MFLVYAHGDIYGLMQQFFKMFLNHFIWDELIKKLGNSDTCG